MAPKIHFEIIRPLVWYDKGPQDIIVILQDIVVKTGKNLAINKFHLEPPSELPWH